MASEHSHRISSNTANVKLAAATQTSLVVSCFKQNHSQMRDIILTCCGSLGGRREEEGISGEGG